MLAIPLPIGIDGRNEGLASNRPPLFTGNNYGFWKIKMMFTKVFASSGVDLHLEYLLPLVLIHNLKI